jgi:GDP-L-fucose synthase
MSILVAGASGLVGSAIFDELTRKKESPIGINSKVVDLRDRKATFEYVLDLRPEIIIDAAARVGGIGANNNKPVQFLSDNLQIQNNLMDAAHEAGVERFVFLGSSCIYPKSAPQPIKEEYLLTGPLEPTNSAYAVAKIAGIESVKSYRKQFGHHWISLMPSNVYGDKDNFNVETGHVLPALINKFVSASEKENEKVKLWGSGTPKREFLHATDLARAVTLTLEKYDEDSHLNVGSGKDLSIKELAQLIASKSGYTGEISWDDSMPDGTPRKLLDISRISELGWAAEIELSEGIEQTIQYFRNQRGKVAE